MTARLTVAGSVGSPVIAGNATWPDITRSAPAAMAARKGANSSERSRSAETGRTGSA